MKSKKKLSLFTKLVYLGYIKEVFPSNNIFNLSTISYIYNNTNFQVTENWYYYFLASFKIYAT
jgi:hypothetical protein